MPLAELALENLRCIQRAELDLASGANLIHGPNASGKTTLIRLLLGEIIPLSGTIRHGTRLEIAYFDQLKAVLDEEKTVQQNVSEYDTIPINGQPRHVIGYLQDFLFAPERSRGRRGNRGRIPRRGATSRQHPR